MLNTLLKSIVARLPIPSEKERDALLVMVDEAAPEPEPDQPATDATTTNPDTPAKAK